MKPYKKDFIHSYSIGVYPTLELVSHQPHDVIKVIVSSRAGRNKGADEIKKICAQYKIPSEINDGWINKISKSENAYVVGVFKKYLSDLNSDENHLVLVNPSDMGNLGTIIRTMVGFSIKNLAIIKPASDIFNPKVVRASMGAIFQINFKYFDRFSDYQNTYPRNIYPFITGARLDLEEVNFHPPFALVFGSEGAGLPPEFHKIGTGVKISQEKGIDSLNLSIAVGISLYKAFKSKK